MTTELLEHDEGGDGAGVGPPVVAEVVVRRVLAAERGAGLGHDRLDVAVADTGAHRGAAVLADDLGHGLRADQVVQDRGAGFLGQHALGDDRGGDRAGDRLAEVVDEEDPIGVAVEGEADVGARLEDPRLEVDEVVGVERVGRVVREVAVELAVHDLDVDRQRREHGGDDEATHAVGGVGHDLQRARARWCR